MEREPAQVTVSDRPARVEPGTQDLLARGGTLLAPWIPCLKRASHSINCGHAERSLSAGEPSHSSSLASDNSCFFWIRTLVPGLISLLALCNKQVGFGLEFGNVVLKKFVIAFLYPWKMYRMKVWAAWRSYVTRATVGPSLSLNALKGRHPGRNALGRMVKMHFQSVFSHFSLSLADIWGKTGLTNEVQYCAQSDP